MASGHLAAQRLWRLRRAHDVLFLESAFMDKDLVHDAIGMMVDAVNRGDFATAASSFQSEPLIVEDLPPFR